MKASIHTVRNSVALLVGVVGLAAAASVGVIGCGGDGDDATTEAETTGTTASQGALEIAMGDYFFKPKDPSAAAGSVTISAPNDGEIVHELVLAKTDADPAKLPTSSNGDVDEAKLEARGELAGEIADVEAGGTKQGTFKLTAGRYVMFCNVPGHYKQGMYGTLTVK
jgi:uncharacterized cupredoxin-like copper-binding protein